MAAPLGVTCSSVRELPDRRGPTTVRDPSSAPVCDYPSMTAKHESSEPPAVGSGPTLRDRAGDGADTVEIGQEIANAAMAATADVDTRARISPY
jgi:hypothetical protein